MEVEVICPDCDITFDAEQDVGEEGECPNCHKKFIWDFDCGDEYSAVLIPDWQSKKSSKIPALEGKEAL